MWATKTKGILKMEERTYTTKQLATVLQCSEKRISNTFGSHKDQFKHGEDYMDITGGAIAELKQAGVIPQNSKGMVRLWSIYAIEKFKRIWNTQTRKRKQKTDTTALGPIVAAINGMQNTVATMMNLNASVNEDKDKLIEKYQDEIAALKLLLDEKDKRLQEKDVDLNIYRKIVTKDI